MALFKFGGLKIIRQTAKLNTPPIILRIRYSLIISLLIIPHYTVCVCVYRSVHCCIVLSYMVVVELMMPMVMNAHFIVKEKQLRLKELMTMMGLSNSVHQTA